MSARGAVPPSGAARKAAGEPNAAPDPAGGGGSGAALTDARAAIEALDVRLVALLGERLRLAREAGEAKRAAGLPTLDPAREAAVVRRAALAARQAGLPVEPVRDIFWHIVGLCRGAQAEER